MDVNLYLNKNEKEMQKMKDEHNLAIGQAMEIDAIFAGWKREMPITTVTRRQEKVLELMRQLDKVGRIG